jgi:hypothetical protein
MTEVERIGRGWHTLLKRGLLHGRIRGEGAFAVLDLDLDLDHAPHRGCSATPPLANAYNTAYERVYPDGLTELGIPATALTSRKAWEQWLYG